MTMPLPKVNEIERKWYVVDASDKVLGRLATQIAIRLRGKHKPIFTPHLDTGDFIIVVNADKIRLTGGKLDKKLYYRHSGYLGSMKAATARKLLDTKPEKGIQRMLPKNRLGRSQLKKLKIYAGPKHPHQAQIPEQLHLNS